MPVVIVEMWKGRTPEQYKQLAKGITDSFVKLGTHAESVQIILKENDKSHWAIAGKLCSEE